jgi:hypothetical protein
VKLPSILPFLSYVAAAFFFGCAVFGVDLHTSLIADGLFCAAIGLALSSAP